MRGRLRGKPTARDCRLLAPSDATRREETAMFDLRRRESVVLLGGAAATRLLAARARNSRCILVDEAIE
jgi:hypothetical protein